MLELFVLLWIAWLFWKCFKYAAITKPGKPKVKTDYGGDDWGW